MSGRGAFLLAQTFRFRRIRVTEDAAAATDNRVFFAAAYDGTQRTGNARFYFGTADQAAQPDSDAMDCDRGVLPELGLLTVGNLSPMAAGRDETWPAGCRVFRGTNSRLPGVQSFVGAVLREATLQSVP